ncbi:unnamed protein product [Peniophora sp. CBMAI 1063]|nr:unnamed protein product [Peniophora sp. CBMAI 1063]
MQLLGFEISLSTAVATTVALYVGRQLFEDRKLRDIPAIGYTFPILNWITAVQHIFNARVLISEGYKRYPNGVFRIAVHDGWLVIASGPQLVEEVRRAPEDTLSFEQAMVRRIQLRHTLGDDVLAIPYHTDVMRAALTRNIDPRFNDIRDEIVCAFEEEVGAEKEWKEVPAIETAEHIVSRVNNRFFVNLPLCRDRDWMRLNVNYAVNAAMVAVLLNFLPVILRPLVSRAFLSFHTERRRANELVGPLIARRIQDFAEDGEKTEDLPNDLITWLLDGCPPELREVPFLTNRILIVNFAAIHSSRVTFLRVLYKLAANPEWVSLMREEVERVLVEEGWSKSALAQMRRLDSLIRETQRMETPDLTSMNRWVCKPFTFSNGVRIPAGCLLACPADAMHTDVLYHGEDAAEFNPWRYSDPTNDSTYQMVATSPTYLAFGHGRNACPGRHLAANEIKGMLAHLVLEYDVRFKNGEGPLSDWEIGNNILPRDAILEFRRRAAA